MIIISGRLDCGVPLIKKNVSCKSKPKPYGNMRFFVCLLCMVGVATTVRAQSDNQRWQNKLGEARSDSAKVDVYGKIFLYYQYLNPDSANYFLEKGLKEFTEKKYLYGIASLTNLMGLEDGIQSRPEMAGRRFAQALELFKKLGDRKGIASVYNGMGIREARTGNSDKAVQYFMIALKEFEALHDTPGIVSTYVKLAVTNEQSNNLDKAVEYNNKVLAMIKSDSSAIKKYVLTLNNIGVVYAKKLDFRKAVTFFNEALAKCNSKEMIGERISSLTNLGIAYSNLDSDEKSIAYFDECLKIINAKDLPEDYLRVMLNRSAVIRKKNPSGGVETLKEAVATAKRIGQKLLLVDIYDDMTDMYVEQKDYKKAYETYREEKRLSDSLFNIEKSKEIANLQSVYELERSNARVSELEALSEKNMQKRDIIIIVATVLAGTLILLLFVYRKSKMLNALLTKREKELQKSSSIKDKLFSIIGHDLRGPIGNIPMMLQMLKDGAMDSDEQKYIIDSLIEHSKASTETLDKLLYWGQSQIKGIGLKQENFQTKAYIENTLHLVKSSAEVKHISIVDNTPTDVMVYADTAHFDFIIRNLLFNAIKFTYRNGLIEISADKNKLPGFTVFAVKDNGTGITKEAMPRIFESFSSSAVGTANEKGTSIGLMLCKEFVKENGGTIWVDSEEGKGSIFYFSLKNSSPV